MNKVLLAGLAVVALAVGAPTAEAHPPPHNYAGGCSINAVNNPTGTLGGRRSWNGELHILARSTTGDEWGTPTFEPIEVRCEVYVDGMPTGIEYDRSGVGVVAGAVKVEYTTDEASVVAICEHVVVGGDPNYPFQHTHCEDATTTPLVPEPVQNAVITLIDILRNEALSDIDPTLCGTVLRRLDGQWGPVFISTQGDIYLFGHTDEEHLWWDCPPYSGGRRWPTPDVTSS